jgi:hypothetical protein
MSVRDADRNRCAVAGGGDPDEPLGAGWAPLREPSLSSGSLRSAQPAPSGDVITEGNSFKDYVLEGRREMGLPLSSKPYSVVQRMGSTSGWSKWGPAKFDCARIA